MFSAENFADTLIAIAANSSPNRKYAAAMELLSGPNGLSAEQVQAIRTVIMGRDRKETEEREKAMLAELTQEAENAVVLDIAAKKRKS